MRLNLLLVVSLSGCFTVDPPSGVQLCHPPNNACATGYFCFMGDGHCYKNGSTPGGQPDLNMVPSTDMAVNMNTDMDMAVKMMPDLAGDFAVGTGVSAIESSIDFAPTSPLANGHSSSVITITVRDGFGNAMMGKTVSLGATGSMNSLVQPSAPTDTNGVTTGTITSSVAETKTITATVDQVGFSAGLTFAPVLAHSLVFTTPPGNKVNNSLPTLAVSALDADSQLITTTSVLITLDLMVPDMVNIGQYVVATPGSMTGNNQENTVGGIAQFSNLAIPTSGTNYEMRASAANAPPVFSAPFEVTSASIATPTNVTATVTNHSSITIAWSAVSGVAKYNIYRHPPAYLGQADSTVTVNVPTVNYLDPFLMHGTWSYTVDAEDGSGLKSAPSAAVTAGAERELCVVDGNNTPDYAGIVVIPTTQGNFTYPPLRTITASAFNQQNNLAVDLTNQLIYVSNLGTTGSDTSLPVQVFNRTDNSLTGTVTPIKTFNVASPAGSSVHPALHGIALDPANNEFVVVDSGTPALIAYNTANTSAPSWTVSGTSVATPLASAWGVAVYRNGTDSEYYVTTTAATNSIVKYSRATIIAGLVSGNYNGAPALALDASGTAPNASLSAPRVPFVYHGPATGVAPPVVGDNLYVMNATTGAMSDGSVSWWALPITGSGTITTAAAGHFSNTVASRAYAAAIDPVADALYLVLNGTTNTVNIFNTNGATNPGGVSVSGSFGKPTDIAFCN